MTVEDKLATVGDEKLRRLGTYASVGVATLLIVAKLIAYLMTDSVAMMSSLLDSTVDLIASLVTVYGVAQALQPPDREHRFGHGKAEPLSALAQAAFIVGSLVLLIYEALNRLYHPHSLNNQSLAYGVMAFSIVMTIFLIAFQRYVIRRTSSIAIGADSLHYLGDLAVNIAVVASFVLYEVTGLYWLDPVFAIAIAVGLGYSAFHIAQHALKVLMDQELPDEQRNKIKSIVKAMPKVQGLHDLRTRTDGDRIFIEFHLELDGEMTLRAAHMIDDAIMHAIKKEFPNSDVLIHQDPEGLDEVRLDEKIARVEGA